jgi:hypothetical protein
VTSQDRREETTERDQPEASVRDASDSYPEMSRLLTSRRWETHDGPFRGFGSPPGRFA